MFRPNRTTVSVNREGKVFRPMNHCKNYPRLVSQLLDDIFQNFVDFLLLLPRDCRLVEVGLVLGAYQPLGQHTKNTHTQLSIGLQVISFTSCLLLYTILILTTYG